MGFLEEMSPAAELGSSEEAAWASPGCQLTMKLEGRELPRMSECNEHPKQVSPASWGLVGQQLGGQIYRWTRLHGCGCVPSPHTSLGGYWCRDTWVLA